MIDILVPVLGRPQNAQPLVDSIRASTTVPHTIMFLCSQGDKEQIVACGLTLADYVVVTKFPAGPGDYAKKINGGYKGTRSPYVFTAADDVEFTPGWDTAILRVAYKTNAGMVGSNDDANPLVKRGAHSTHTLFSRDYIDSVGATFFDGPGVVFHEGYAHQWVDTEAVKAAQDRGQWAFARLSVVRHHHPFFPHKGQPRKPMDATYEKALGDARQDSALFKHRVREWTQKRRNGAITTA